MNKISIGIDGMTLEDLISISRKDYQVMLKKESETSINNAGRLIEKWVQEEKTIYGVTTGFGALSNVVISKKDTRKLQENILMSHAAGVGNSLDKETVRAIMEIGRASCRERV